VLNIEIVLPNESDIYISDIAFDLLVISFEMKCRLYSFGLFIHVFMYSFQNTAAEFDIALLSCQST